MAPIVSLPAIFTSVRGPSNFPQQSGQSYLWNKGDESVIGMMLKPFTDKIIALRHRKANDNFHL